MIIAVVGNGSVTSSVLYSGMEWTGLLTILTCDTTHSDNSIQCNVTLKKICHQNMLRIINTVTHPPSPPATVNCSTCVERQFTCHGVRVSYVSCDVQCVCCK